MRDASHQPVDLDFVDPPNEIAIAMNLKDFVP